MCDTRRVIEPLVKPRPVPSAQADQPPFAYLWQDVLEELRFSGTWRSDQVGAGLLVGHHYRDPETNESYVEIDGFIAGAHFPDASSFSRHLRQEWRAAGAAVRGQFGDAELVGWYMAGPRPMNAGQAEFVLHNTFFSHPWQVGLWVEPDDTAHTLTATGGQFVRRPAGLITAP